jgi:hypothetical protein
MDREHQQFNYTIGYLLLLHSSHSPRISSAVAKERSTGLAAGTVAGVREDCIC